MGPLTQSAPLWARGAVKQRTAGVIIQKYECRTWQVFPPVRHSPFICIISNRQAMSSTSHTLEQCSDVGKTPSVPHFVSVNEVGLF